MASTTAPSPELQTVLQDLSAHYITLASRYFHRNFPLPLLTFTLRGKSAGTAHMAEWKIRLNPVLLRDNEETFKTQVLPHEIAHLIAFAMWGRVRPHGAEWQSVMQQVFHCPAERTHRMDVSQVSGPTFAYQCQCQTYQLSQQRHRKVQVGKARYYCRKCGQFLHPSTS